MSAQYARSLRYRIAQCDWLLKNIGTIWPDWRRAEEDACQEAIDFLEDLRDGRRNELADITVDITREKN